jgi:phosphoribosylformylglycinamidine (FGAM) synthase-like amidotransferase family enzyme
MRVKKFLGGFSMKNVFKVLGIIAIVAVIGFTMAACDNNPGGGGGDVTFNVTNNYTSKAVSVKIESNASADADTTKEISIDGNGGTGSFKVKLTKIITGDYMGQLTFTFEDGSEKGNNSSSYSFDGSKSKFTVVIKTNGYHDQATNE